jgi:tRNA(fMet)-specific endonuclease VapC
VRHLLDTDWVADYLKGRSPAVALISRLIPDGIAISVITLAEVYEGIYYGSDPVHDERGLRRFLRGVIVLHVDTDVARRYAVIRGSLRQQGLLIPQPDILIAATAIHHDLILVTRNLRHYRRIPGLKLHQDPPLPT